MRVNRRIDDWADWSEGEDNGYGCNLTSLSLPLI